jgi:hypothetical protein
MSDLYDVLELCLQEIEKGMDLETVLSRYPRYADELRPILETSVQAIQLASPGPSLEVERRGRAKVLQHAAQMREAQAHSQIRQSRRLWSVPLRRALVTLAVIGVLFIGSTRLVEASSTTLPGDNLYPVKRTWEDVRVFFTFNNQARETLEVEHENERLDELNDLFTKGRSAKVDFAGTVMSQNGDLWEVSKIPVLVSSLTQINTQPVMIGDAVRVKGYTQSGGTVVAERLDLLPSGIPLPKAQDDQTPESGQETPEGEQQQNSGGDSEEGFSAQGLVPTQQAESKSRDFSRSGLVTSRNGNTLVVNGQSMDISGATIEGTLKVGATVKVEGYFDANGQFVVTKLEFQSSGSESGNSASDNGSQDKGGDMKSEDNGGSHEDDGGDDHNDNSSSSSGGGGGD